MSQVEFTTSGSCIDKQGVNTYITRVMRAEVNVVVGGQWGDEGKGKIIDQLAQDANLSIRAHGGNNAGHTVVNEQGKFALHLIPSGIFNPNTQCIVAAGVALNPESFIGELNSLECRGVSTDNLFISPKAHLVLAYHQTIDHLQEELRGKEKIGTTGKGIGPAYTDKAERIGLRADILKDYDQAMKAIDGVLARKRKLWGVIQQGEFDSGFYEDLIWESVRVLGPRIVDTQAITQQHVAKGSKILIEGAQGALLCLDHGMYPNVTSSNASIASALAYSGIPAIALTRAIGVYKAYQSKVGEGGMPSELFDGQSLQDGQADLIRERGGEYGTTTGRPRRIGYFDGVAARYAQEVNGFTDIVVTKLDTLSECGDLYICNKYTSPDGILTRFPDNDAKLQQCVAAYDERDFYEGWNENLEGVRDYWDLPENPRRYIDGLRKNIPGARLWMIGVGAGRDAIIFPPLSIDMANAQPPLPLYK